MMWCVPSCGNKKESVRLCLCLSHFNVIVSAFNEQKDKIDRKIKAALKLTIHLLE